MFLRRLAPQEQTRDIDRVVKTLLSANQSTPSQRRDNSSYGIQAHPILE